MYLCLRIHTVVERVRRDPVMKETIHLFFSAWLVHLSEPTTTYISNLTPDPGAPTQTGQIGQPEVFLVGNWNSWVVRNGFLGWMNNTGPSIWSPFISRKINGNEFDGKRVLQHFKASPVSVCTYLPHRVGHLERTVRRNTSIEMTMDPCPMPLQQKIDPTTRWSNHSGESMSLAEI